MIKLLTKNVFYLHKSVLVLNAFSFHRNRFRDPVHSIPEYHFTFRHSMLSYFLIMQDVHARFRTESHQDVTGRFNER